jgi:hypothetical protein
MEGSKETSSTDVCTQLFFTCPEDGVQNMQAFDLSKMYVHENCFGLMAADIDKSIYT